MKQAQFAGEGAIKTEAWDGGDAGLGLRGGYLSERVGRVGYCTLEVLSSPVLGRRCGFGVGGSGGAGGSEYSAVCRLAGLSVSLCVARETTGEAPQHEGRGRARTTYAIVLCGEAVAAALLTLRRAGTWGPQ